MALDRVARSLAIVMGPNPESTTETLEEPLGNKERLPSSGDRWEALLSKRLELDAPCRDRGSSVP